MILSSILNVVLDLVLIINFHMGVAGAGIATVFSQFVSAVLCTIYTIKRYSILKLKKSDFRVNKTWAWAHLRVGLPMALQFSVTAVGVMVLQSALNVFGSEVIASFTAASKVETLVTSDDEQPWHNDGYILRSESRRKANGAGLKKVCRSA